LVGFCEEGIVAVIGGHLAVVAVGTLSLTIPMPQLYLGDISIDLRLLQYTNHLLHTEPFLPHPKFLSLRSDSVEDDHFNWARNTRADHST